MNHYIVKLITGEFVYGVLDTENTDKKMIIMENPLTWEEYDSPDGVSGSALVKFVSGTRDSSVPIATHSIISITAMSDAFTDFYDAAVAVQKITDEAYDDKIRYMTRKMCSLVMDYQAQAHADETNGIVGYSTDTDITIH